jgi:hypothetical protein
MRTAVILAVGILSAGCDYMVPLVKTPSLAIDSGVVGLWQRPKDKGETERLLVLPIGKQEYLVSYPSESKDAMFARACLCRVAATTLVQLEWFGTARGGIPDDPDNPEDRRVYQFAAYSVTGATLTVRMLNTDVVKKAVDSTDKLAKAIAANLAKPDLFLDEMVFTKVKN